MHITVDFNQEYLMTGIEHLLVLVSTMPFYFMLRKSNFQDLPAIQALIALNTMVHGRDPVIL